MKIVIKKINYLAINIILILGLFIVFSCSPPIDDSEPPPPPPDIPTAKWQETKLLASDGELMDCFGRSVDVSSSGDVIVVGAYFDNVGDKIDQGSTYIYNFDGLIWNEEKITAQDGDYSDEFGSSVSISGNSNIFVSSAPNKEIDGFGEGNGAVYIYKKNESDWENIRLVLTDPNINDYFGRSVSISLDSNTIVVGAPNVRINNEVEHGAAYIYKYNGDEWIETELIASDGEALDHFGESVSVSDNGETIVIGAPITNSIIKEAKAYIYKWDGIKWDETKLTTDGYGSSVHAYGDTVCVSGDGNTVAVGAPNANQQGAVYIYKYIENVWIENEIILSDGEGGDRFGCSIAITANGNTIVIGASGRDTVYLFRWNGYEWSQEKIFNPSDEDDTSFGLSVAIIPNGNTVVVGSPRSIIDNVRKGIVYIYNYKTS